MQPPASRQHVLAPTGHGRAPRWSPHRALGFAATGILVGVLIGAWAPLGPELFALTFGLILLFDLLWFVGRLRRDRHQTAARDERVDAV